MKIREATIDDIESLISLFHESEELHRTNLPDQFRKPSLQFVRDFYADHFRNEKIKIFVAEIDNKVIGFARLLLKETPNLEILVHTKTARVEEIVVAQDYRKNGVGKEL